MTETVNTRHTVTGKIQRLTHDQVEPFKNVLEIVADDAKPYEPGLFKPGVVGEFANPSADAEQEVEPEEGEAEQAEAPATKSKGVSK